MPVNKDARFWLAMVLLFSLAAMGAINLYALPTSFVYIAQSLDTQKVSWVAQSQLITTIALMPLCGSLKNIFGSRATVLGFLALFAAGTLISALANTLVVMLVGRCIQGLGNSGVYVLPIVILNDLVPVSERGLWCGVILSAWGLGGMIGPLISGALAEQWRWLLWMCLILTGVATPATIYSMPHDPLKISKRQQLKRLDYVGNAIFVAATTSFNLAITWGGVTYAWGNFRVLLPLVLGVAGYALFFWYESGLEHPTTPIAIFRTRTGNAAMICIGIQSMMQSILLYYLPLQIQSVQLKSATSSGIYLLPFTAPFEIIGILAGLWCTWSRSYKWQNVVFWPFVIFGFVCLGLLRADTAAIGFIGSELVLGLSLGGISDIWTLPVLAALPHSLATPALAFGAVSRYVFVVAGTSIGITVVQNRLRQQLPADFLALLPPSQDIAWLGVSKISQASPDSLPQIQTAYSDSLRLLWLVLIAPAGVAFLLSFLIREIPMRTTVASDDADVADSKDEAMPTLEEFVKGAEQSAI